LKRYITYNNPVSTFIAGLLAGLYTPQRLRYLIAIPKGIGSYITSQLLDAIEETYYDKFVIIINKFTSPIDTVVKSIKDKSFIAPNSKFYDIIQTGVTLLLLFLGFAIGKIIAVLRDTEKKENLFKQYKKFIKVNLITFVLIFGIAFFMRSYLSHVIYGEYHKIDFSAFKDSDNKIKRVVAKVYDLVVTKYPEFAKVPLYYIDENDTFGFYAIKLTNKSIIGIPKKLITPLTEDDLIAIYLHEFGHLLNVPSHSAITLLALSVVVTRVRLLTRISRVQLVTTLGSDIIDRFFASVASFNKEIIADTFTVSMGYGPQLKLALQKLERACACDSTTIDPTNLFIHRFLSHPIIDNRVDYMEQAEKHFKQETSELIQKSTEMITTELNKGEASV